MNYFLLLIIIGLGCGGYYEFNTFQNKLTNDKVQLTDLGAQVDKLTAANTKLEADNKQLTKAETDAEAATADLTKQLQDAQTQLAEQKQKNAGAPSSISAGSNPPPKPTPGTNDLGTFGTQDGKVFPNTQLMKVCADCIVVSYAGGITQVPYTVMPPQLQKRFGFDPMQSITLTPDQVAVLEQKRIAAGQTAGN